MNKNAIKKFAIEARKKLIDSVTDKAGMLGITEKSCSEPITKGPDFEVYQTIAGTEVTLNKRQCEQRRRLVSQIESRGFEAVVEEVAYTWFNRICAIRFMEVNDYLPNRVRVLSSEKEGKMEPDLVTQAPDVDLDLTAQEKEEIINWKMSGTSEDTDKMFGKLFLKQCHQLHDILPGLFEADSDYMELLFGISYTNKDDVIYMLVNQETGIPEADFNVSIMDEEGNPTGQVEIIGWLYQYYNTELKDDTFAKLKKNVKITKERIPAATQLFTPDWIVRYMVENSVGRIWIEHLRAVDPSTDEKATAERFGWKYYLPEAEQEEEVNEKLAEIRTTYKDLKPTDITCIDPCMGSGHILIAMFDVLMDIYESAGYDKREAAFEIVEHNIHGLDIDQRAYQLAYFAVMMKGRGYNRRFLRGRDGKPEPKVYAIVESNEINRNHLQFFGTHLSEMERNLAVMQIEGLLDTFVDAREYGSILNVDVCDWDVLERFVDDLGTTGQISFESVGSEETQESLRKLVRVAKNLGQKYDAVVTNPPYMGNGGFSPKLTEYVHTYYSDSKNDLYSIMIERCGTMTRRGGFTALITMQSWINAPTFKKLRKKLFSNYCFSSIINMGSRAFDEIQGEKVKNVVFIFRNQKLGKWHPMFADLTSISGENEKRLLFLRKQNLYDFANQSDFLLHEQCLVVYKTRHIQDIYEPKQTISDVSEVRRCIATGNDNTFIHFWYEVNACTISSIDKCNPNAKWFFIADGGERRRWYGNINCVLNWGHDGRDLRAFNDQTGKSTLRNLQFMFKKGLTYTYTSMGSGIFNARTIMPGMASIGVGPVIVDCKSDIQMAAFVNSAVFRWFWDIMYGKVSTFETGNVGRIAYKEGNPNLLQKNVDAAVRAAKEDWDSFEGSIGFQRHPLCRRNSIESAFYEWNDACNNRFYITKTAEETMNLHFIDIYGLQDELTPEVEDKDVTVRRADLGRDIRSFISYAVGCMFGRYSLDVDGLVYAGGEWDASKYASFAADKDNIIPICDDEYFEDDIVGLFVDFVKTVYGADTLEENLDFIANALGNKGDTSREVIRNYFLKDFYTDHLKIYQKRPIYWLFDSGKQNGFKALIYMHRYDANTVGRVRTDYLHRAQKYVETAMQSAQYTIDNASSALEKSKATKAATKYTKQLAEMKIYDEAIAHIANQRIEIDLDDGVKVNYAKFQGVEVAQEGKKALKVDLLAKIR